MSKKSETHTCCRSYRRKLNLTFGFIAGLTALAFVTGYFLPNPYIRTNGFTSYTTGVRNRIENLLTEKDIRWKQEPDGPIRPFLHLSNRYLASSKYDLGIAYVPKIMSTALFTTVCYLENETILEEARTRLQLVSWHTNYERKIAGLRKVTIVGCQGLCKGIRICKDASQPQTTPELFDVLSPEHTFFQLVRDPLERFISAFVHLCVAELDLLKRRDGGVCFGCKNELECVVRTLYRDLFNISRTDGTRFNYHWGKFGRGFYLAHFMPQTWFSDLSERYNKMEFIKYGSKGDEKELMVYSVLRLLDSVGVEKRMLRSLGNYYRDEKPRLHATRGLDLPNTVREDILKSKEMINLLEKIYRYDYKVFGYEPPSLLE